MVYWAQHHFDCDGGCAITGSHNPPEWNGLKLALGRSYTISGDEITELKDIAMTLTPLPLREGVGRGENLHAENHDISQAYYSDLLGRAEITKKFRVVVDAGNGTAGAFAPELFRQAGCEVLELYCDINPSYPNHFPDPTLLEAREAVRQKVLESGADLGFAFDGDGDRLGVNDNLGRTIWNDQLMIMWSRDILSRRAPGAAIVFDVKCSDLLAREIESAGGRPVMCKTGHPFVKKELKLNQAALGGEMSGHTFFSERFYGVDDALYAGLRLLEYLSHTNKSLAEELDALPKSIATPEIRVHCPDEHKFGVPREVGKRFAEKGCRVVTIDGARISFEHGWGLVRASNNLPMLVLRFEADSQEHLDEYIALVRSEMQTIPYGDGAWENL